jgi:hypothetical protein
MGEFRYRGREIGQEDILYIRRLIERHPKESAPQAVDQTL